MKLYILMGRDYRDSGADIFLGLFDSMEKAMQAYNGFLHQDTENRRVWFA